VKLLKKTILDPEDRRKDNSDKKELFTKELHPKKANTYKDEWGFIQEKIERENIAYQLQYLEFMTNLYNEYQIYLTTESLLAKNLIITIAGIIESALFNLISQIGRKHDFKLEDRTEFLKAIDMAYGARLIDTEMRDAFHDLRKIRNSLHLTGTTYQEHQAYTVDQVNTYLEVLNKFREKMLEEDR